MMWSDEREARLTEMWHATPVRTIAERLETSVGAVYRQARKLGLKTKQRTSRRLDPGHRAVVRGRPRFEKSIVTAETSPKLLVEGKESRKIGRRVTKGAWAGMPIYTLTLAERLTCPRSCVMWDGCYGNNLHWSRRHLLDRALIERLRWELTALAARHPAGFVVRPHILGDFGSDDEPALALEYVAAWRSWMVRFPAMRVFGYTAHAPDSAVGAAVMGMNIAHPDRCRIRFSNTELDGYGARVIETVADSRHVVCPYETEKVADCGSCGLCWSMNRVVEFVRH